MAGKTASEAQREEPQEPAGGVAPATIAQAATTPTPASASTEPGAQEQTVGQQPSLTPEQIGELLQSKQAQATIFRQAQSLKDKMLHQERLKRQQQEEEEARQQRESAMDDEEYGRYVREQSRTSGLVEALAKDSLGRVLTNMQTQALSTIGDKALRAEMAKKASTYPSLPEFMRACVEVELERRSTAQTPKREKELRDLITKEQMGEQASELVPQLGQGLPSAGKSKLHGRERIAAELAEMRKTRK